MKVKIEVPAPSISYSPDDALGKGIKKDPEPSPFDREMDRRAILVTKLAEYWFAIRDKFGVAKPVSRKQRPVEVGQDNKIVGRLIEDNNDLEELVQDMEDFINNSPF